MGERLYGLDWLRIGAFALLILYHIGMFFLLGLAHQSRAGAALARAADARHQSMAPLAAVPDLRRRPPPICSPANGLPASPDRGA
jgi:hypothetical protein